MMENTLYRQIKTYLTRHFDVRQEKEDEIETIESLKKGVEFRGTNLWVLIFAVFLASLGLNTNSTAVIIGAMLISPLMGPIMGFGLGLGITDFDLVKRSLRHYLTATAFSVAKSTAFFLISPISEAQRELLHKIERKRDSRGGHCYGIDASIVYSRLRTGQRKFKLFLRRFLPLFHQHCFYQCRHLYRGAHLKISSQIIHR